ncbi:MAG: efflux RND transporter periplasmic adaptor subunit [Desulfonatronovibrionaceae bacterium]
MKNLLDSIFSGTRRDPIPAFMLFCLVLSFIFFLNFAHDLKQQTAAEQLPQSRPDSSSVKIQAEASIKARGKAQEFSTVEIRSQISGTLTFLEKQPDPGHILDKGQVLASVDQGPYLVRLQKANLRAQAAQARLTILEQTAYKAHEKWNKYLTRKHFEPDPLDEYQPAIIREQEKLAAALSDIEMIRLALEKTVIKAPFPARLVSLPKKPGEQVKPGTLTAVLEDIRNLEIHARISEHALKRLERQNNSAEDGAEPEILIRMAGSGQTPYRPARIQRISRYPDAGSKAELVLKVNDPLSVMGETRHEPYISPGADVEIMIIIHT